MPDVSSSTWTRSQIESCQTTHLESAATQWTAQAEAWESHFETIHRVSLSPGGAPWEGAGADAAQHDSFADLVRVRGLADHLRAAATAARSGAGDIARAKSQALQAIADAEAAGFTVGEDLSVSDANSTSLNSDWDARQADAQRFAAEIRSQAQNLATADKTVAASITAALAPLGENGVDGTPGQPTIQAASFGQAPFPQDVPGGDQPNPTITGPAAPPQHEQNGYDLQDQFQDGKGPTFGGDPRDGVPRDPDSQLAQGPPGTRPLPTGTAIGPDGHRYVFFSNAPNTPPTDDTTNPYVGTSSVWDYADPAHPVKVGDLPGVFQGSGVYDPATRQMVIVGNTSNQTGDTTRGMWTSGPIDAANPNSWINSLQRVGDVSLPGDRESQLVALQGGGYALVGATNGGPLQAITAATPQGLTSAIPQTLISQDQLPTVYGPTVTGTSIDPATGLETIQLRVSTWPPGPTYDPNTWTTSFGVQH